MGAIATDARPAAASPIKSIQRGSVNAASVTITHVDPAKSLLNLLSSATAYASRHAWAKKVSSAAATGGTGDRVLVSQTRIRHSVSIALASDGNSLTRSSDVYGSMGYELVEYV